MDNLTFNCFEEFVTEVTDFSENFSKMQFSDGLSYELKEDNTPVTDIDLQIETFLRNSIEQTFPDHSITGEEFSDKICDSTYKWVIDPIDGTLSLTRGVPLFGVLVGVLNQLDPLFGCVRFPLLGNKLISGNGEIAFENGTAIHCSNNSELNEALILTTDESRVATSKYKRNWQHLTKSVGHLRSWGDCYGYYLVCSGKAQVMLDIDLKPCDILPLIPIIKGAGCEIIELRKPYKDIIVCSKDVHNEVLNFF